MGNEFFKAMVDKYDKFKGFAYGNNQKQLDKHIKELRKKDLKPFGKTLIK